MKSFPSLLLLLFPLTAVCQGSLSIQNFDPTANDRFADDPAFIGSAYDWSGVGRGADGSWGTMISPNVFISANHYHPGVSGTLTFYSNNDPSSTPITATIAGGQQIGTSDLWIGYLDSALPSTVENYSYATIPLTTGNYALSGLANSSVLMSGLSPSLGYTATTNQTVGTNRVEGFQAALTSGGSTGDVLFTIDNQAGDPGYTLTPYEASVNVGDSGSPLMLTSGGQLTVAGIAWLEGTGDISPGVTRNLSVYTYTGNYATPIAAFVALHAVPEPAAASLACLGAALAFSRRRRR